LTLLSVFLTIGGAIFSALYAVYARKVRLLHSAQVAGTQFLIESLVLLLLLPSGISLDPTPRFLFDLFYISILGGAVLFYLWFVMSKIETVGRLTILTFSVPAATVIVQFFESRYVPPPVSIVGICLIFLGIIISRQRAVRLKIEPQ
jgi:drug/metabolite transporter (DMT)-like permease